MGVASGVLLRKAHRAHRRTRWEKKGCSAEQGSVMAEKPGRSRKEADEQFNNAGIMHPAYVSLSAGKLQYLVFGSLAMPKESDPNTTLDSPADLYSDDDAISTEERIWDLTQSINVKGVWYGCKHAVLAMRQVSFSHTFSSLDGAAGYCNHLVQARLAASRDKLKHAEQGRPGQGPICRRIHHQRRFFRLYHGRCYSSDRLYVVVQSAKAPSVTFPR